MPSAKKKNRGKGSGQDKEKKNFQRNVQRRTQDNFYTVRRGFVFRGGVGALYRNRQKRKLPAAKRVKKGGCITESAEEGGKQSLSRKKTKGGGGGR